MDVRSGKPRVLVFSMRNIFEKALFRCPHYELEDIICEIDSAELLAPSFFPYSARSNLAMRLAYHAPVTLNPGLHARPAHASYDLFFAVCGGLASPYDMLMLNAVRNARQMCKTSVCLVDEVWASQLSKHRHFLRVLDEFDVVLTYHSQTVKPLSEQIRAKCAYLPPGIDAITFCPYPDPPQRVIDVYSIGRRSAVTHQALLRMAKDSSFFYLHDTIQGSQAIHAGEHRALFANAAKRSRYFIVNPGKIDEPEQTGGQIEFGYRYFEGAASGAIMIGERPRNEVFGQLFDWPDVVTEMPFGSGDIEAVIRRLDRDEERLDTIRRTGVAQSLLRHDWVYRWETILRAAGLEPQLGLHRRKQQLERLSRLVLESRQATPSLSPVH